MKLAERNRIQLIWVQGHMGIDGNKIAEQLPREGSSHPIIGPEPLLGTTAKIATEVIRDWTSRKHEEHWQSICGQREAKGFLRVGRKKTQQRNWGIAQSEQKPDKNNDRVANRILPFKWTPT